MTGQQSDPWFTPVQPVDPWAAPVRAHDSGEPATADYPTRPPQPAVEVAASTTTYPGTGPAQPSPAAPPPLPPQPDAAPAGVVTPVTAQKRRRAILIGLGAVAAILVVTGWLVPGFLRTRILDVHATEERVTYVLTDPAAGYGLTAVADMVCNDGTDPVVRAGATFTCSFTIDGSEYQLEVTTPDNSGVFWVGTPGKT